MKILVFDDSPVNQKSARVQLKDHDLTVVGTYDEASKLLTPSFGHNQPNPWFQKFDVVLTDLMVPASGNNLGRNKHEYEGKEMPLGSIIALLALHVGVKWVALITDTNHHDHPASAALDPFLGGMEEPSQVGDARLYCTNYNVNSVFNAETFEQVDTRHFYGKKGYEYAKDWSKALKALMK